MGLIDTNTTKMSFPVNKEDQLEVLYGAGEKENNNRSAGLASRLGGEDLGFENSNHSVSSKLSAAVSNKGSYTLWTPQHSAFLDQHIFLSKGTDIEETYSFINEELKSFAGFQNYREYPEELKTVGYHIDETREGCYRIQLFAYNNKVGVNCTRLDGDSLALGSLWSKLKARLHEQEYYVDKFLVDNDEDEDIFAEEDNEEKIDVDAFKYLDFSRDEAFVNKLVDDILDTNVGTHALLLLKFNFKKQKNLQLVANNCAQKLFDNSVKLLNTEYSTLPAAICASHIMKQLVENAPELTVSVEQLTDMANAALNLCAENEKSRTIVPTASEEASYFLLESIREGTDKISENNNDLDIQDELQRIYSQTGFDSVRDSAESLIESN